jgi:hypothetical protein
MCLLKDAPAHEKLAVDLIQLLEINAIAPDVAIAALEIVMRDFRNKADRQSSTCAGSPARLQNSNGARKAP